MAKQPDVTRRVAEAQAASLGHLLFSCARLLDELAQAEVNQEAGEVVLRPALVRLLPHLSPRGIRISELAERVDVSKQAVSQSVQALVAAGVVELRPDSDDGRAKRVFLTARGQDAFLHGLAVLARLEERLTAEVGAPTIDAMRTGLQRILPILVDWKGD